MADLKTTAEERERWRGRQGPRRTGGEVKRYLVPREGGVRCPIEVFDDEGPREAAEAYAADRPWPTGDVVLVCREGLDVTTRWRVEPVTTYRARPA